MPVIRASGHPLIDEATRLRAALDRARVYPERHPQYAPLRLERAAARATRRLARRISAYGARVVFPNRRGRPDTKDRPYAVGGRGRRGW